MIPESPPILSVIIRAYKNEWLGSHFQVHINRQRVLFNLDDYATCGQLIKDIGATYLSDNFDWTTYGRNWILIRPIPIAAYAILPAVWVFSPNTSLNDLSPEWLSSTPRTKFHVTPDSHWQVMVKENEGEWPCTFHGLKTDNPEIAKAALNSGKAQVILLDRDYLSVTTAEGTPTHAPVYEYVFRNWMKIDDLIGTVLVDGPKQLQGEFSEIIYRPPAIES